MSAAAIVCVSALFAAVYPLLVYPLLVIVWSKIRPRPWRRGPVEAPVVHLITVFNEERRIEAKLENTLALEPPAGGARTLVVGDGPTDGTEALVRRFGGAGVEWLGCPRSGKERAQIAAIAGTTEPIIVFSDASALLEPDALRRIVESFADPGVAAVSGSDRLGGSGGRVGEDLYVRYEMAVRRAESRAGSLVGLSGCFFAARRTVAEQLLPDVPSDLGAALIAIGQGQRAVSDPLAVARYSAAVRAEQEFTRKRRTALRGLRCLFAYRGAMPLTRPVIFWQIVSHKLLRFAVPWFLLVALAATAIAAAGGEPWAVPLLGAASVGLLGALAALRVSWLRRIGPMRAAGFFVMSCAAVICAWADMVRGRSQPVWVPTNRPGAGS